MIGVRCEASQLLEAAEVINALPEVEYLVVTAGSYGLLVEVVWKDHDALLHFLADKLRRVAGVRETETFVYLRMLKPVYTWGTRQRFALGCGIGPAPRVTPAGSVPAARIASTTGNGRPLRSPIQSLQDRCQRVERRERDRVHHQLDVRDPLCREPAEDVRDLLRRARDGRDRRLARSAHDPSRPGREPDLDRERARHPGRIAAGVAACGIHAVAERGHAGRAIAERVEPRIPRVHVRDRDREHPRPRRADHERRAARPRPWRQLAVTGREVGAREIDRPVAEERPHDREGLLETADPVVEREAEGAELRLVPTGAEAQYESAATDLVDRGGLLGQHCRVVERRGGDQWTQQHARRDRGEAGENRPCLPGSPGTIVARPPVDEVIAVPDGVEAQLLGP